MSYLLLQGRPLCWFAALGELPEGVHHGARTPSAETHRPKTNGEIQTIRLMRLSAARGSNGPSAQENLERTVGVNLRRRPAAVRAFWQPPIAMTGFAIGRKVRFPIFRIEAKLRRAFLKQCLGNWLRLRWGMHRQLQMHAKIRPCRCLLIAPGVRRATSCRGGLDSAGGYI